MPSKKGLTKKRVPWNKGKKVTPKKATPAKIKVEDDMSTDGASPKRESTPSGTPIASIPQKRALEDDHQPAVSSPLNPDFKAAKQEDAPLVRERAARAKKESLKKREAKGGSSTPDYGSRSTPDPKTSRKYDDVLAPTRYSFPAPKLHDFEAPRGPVLIPSHEVKAPDGSQIQFNETTDHVYNKRGFQYSHSIADPDFPHTQYYRQSETEPFTARLSFEHTSTHMMLDESARHITTDKGFRMGKANVCAREGRWYWECKITKGISKRKGSDANAQDSGHVRMGWSRREAILDAPVGYDAYSYGLRDVQGQAVFLSRPKDFFPVGEDIKEGDVIGLEINLPSEHFQRKILSGDYNPNLDFPYHQPTTISRADMIRDRVPIRFKSHLYLEQVDYSPVKELEELMNPSPVVAAPTSALPGSAAPPHPKHPVPAMRTLPGSSIKIYKNGVLMGTPFKDLLAFLPLASKPQNNQLGARDGLDDGMLGYYPSISVFRGGAAEINLGPEFWFPPSELQIPDDEVDMIGSDQIPSVPSSGKNSLKKLRAMSERYDEQIVEDIVCDIVDEIDFWEKDGGRIARVLGGGNSAAASGINGDEEIKELVQDNE